MAAARNARTSSRRSGSCTHRSSARKTRATSQSATPVSRPPNARGTTTVAITLAPEASTRSAPTAASRPRTITARAVPRARVPWRPSLGSYDDAAHAEKATLRPRAAPPCLLRSRVKHFHRRSLSRKVVTASRPSAPAPRDAVGISDGSACSDAEASYGSPIAPVDELRRGKVAMQRYDAEVFCVCLQPTSFAGPSRPRILCLGLALGGQSDAETAAIQTGWPQRSAFMTAGQTVVLRWTGCCRWAGRLATGGQGPLPRTWLRRRPGGSAEWRLPAGKGTRHARRALRRWSRVRARP